MKSIVGMLSLFGVFAVMSVTAVAHADNGGTWYGGSGGSYYPYLPYGNYEGLAMRQGTVVESIQFGIVGRHNGVWEPYWTSLLGNGSINRSNNCDISHGYYMTGIHVRSRTLVEHVSMYCSKVGDHSGESNPGWEPGEGYENSDRCTRPGEVVRKVYLRVGYWIDSIAIECGPYQNAS